MEPQILELLTRDVYCFWIVNVVPDCRRLIPKLGAVAGLKGPMQSLLKPQKVIGVGSGF